jgi:hypothetical protein
VPRLAVFPCSNNLACTTCPEDLPHEHYYHGDPEKNVFNPVGVALSRCSMFKVSNEPIKTSTPGVSLVGTFTGVCHLDGGNDKKCDIPEGCDDVEVSITGYKYEIVKAVRVGPKYGGAGADIENNCSSGVQRTTVGGELARLTDQEMARLL